MSRRVMMREFWERFLIYRGLPDDTRWQRCDHFGLTRGQSERLLSLTLISKKNASCQSLARFQAEQRTAPRLGDLSIITDWEGTPRCVLQTTAVAILPFREMTWRLAQQDGENDTYDSWRRDHVAAFIAEGKDLGYTFSPDMQVVLENFKLLYSESGSPEE